MHKTKDSATRTSLLNQHPLRWL